MNWKDACKQTGYASRIKRPGRLIRVKIANGDEWMFDRYGNLWKSNLPHSL